MQFLICQLKWYSPFYLFSTLLSYTCRPGLSSKEMSNHVPLQQLLLLRNCIFKNLCFTIQGLFCQQKVNSLETALHSFTWLGLEVRSIFFSLICLSSANTSICLEQLFLFSQWVKVMISSLIPKGILLSLDFPFKGWLSIKAKLN